MRLVSHSHVNSHVPIFRLDRRGGVGSRARIRELPAAKMDGRFHLAISLWFGNPSGFDLQFRAVKPAEPFPFELRLFQARPAHTLFLSTVECDRTGAVGACDLLTDVGSLWPHAADRRRSAVVGQEHFIDRRCWLRKIECYTSRGKV